MFEFASEARQNGYDIIIAGAGGDSTVQKNLENYEKSLVNKVEAMQNELQ